MAVTEVVLSSRPARVDVELERGDDWTQSFTWTADAVPVDLTGYSAVMTVDDVEAEGAVVLGGDPYNIVLTLTDEYTGGLAAGGHKWELVLTDSAGLIRTLLEGVIDASS